MTKQVIKWYYKVGWWKFTGFVIGPVVVVAEGLILSQQAHWSLHLLTALSSGLLAAIKYYGEDKDGDGIVDVLQKKKKEA